MNNPVNKSYKKPTGISIIWICCITNEFLFSIFHIVDVENVYFTRALYDLVVHMFCTSNTIAFFSIPQSDKLYILRSTG